MNLKQQQNENNFAILRFLAVIAILFSISNALTNGHDDIWVFISGGQSGIANLGESILLFTIGYLAMQSINKYSNIRTYLYARIIGIYPQFIVSIIITTIIANILLIKGYSVDYNYFGDVKKYLFNIFMPLTQERYIFLGNNLSLIAVVAKYHLLISLLYISKIIRFRYLILCLFIGVLIYIQVNPYSFYDAYYYASLISGSLFWLFKDKIKYNWHYAVISMFILLFTSYLGQLWCITFLIFGAYLLFSFAFNKRIRFYGFDKYGDFSYGIFLYGFLVQNIVTIIFNRPMSNILNYLISLPIAIICGVISYKLVEKPCMDLKRKFL